MQGSKQDKSTDRRGFLKLVGSGTVGGAAAALTVSPVAAATGDQQPPSQDGHYRETEHVKTYYDLAKF